MDRNYFGTPIANDEIAERKRAHTEKFLIEIGLVSSRRTNSRPGDMFRSTEDLLKLQANLNYLRSIEEFPVEGRKIAA